MTRASENARESEGERERERARESEGERERGSEGARVSEDGTEKAETLAKFDIFCVIPLDAR